jgi:hypothetical protein
LAEASSPKLIPNVRLHTLNIAWHRRCPKSF